MENVFLELINISPVLGFMSVMWFYQRRDYNKLADETREDNKSREEKMQSTIDKNQDIIHKNQEIISELADKFDVVEDIKKDVAEIKIKIER